MNRTAISERIQTTKGFILVEVVLAMVIISVALIPISTLFIQAIQANGIAKDYTMAANLIQKQLELLKACSPEQWAACALPCTIPWIDTTELPPPRYRLTTSASLSAADEHLVEVTVTAAWQDRGKQCSMQFVTLYNTL